MQQFEDVDPRIDEPQICICVTWSPPNSTALSVNQFI